MRHILKRIWLAAFIGALALAGAVTWYFKTTGSPAGAAAQAPTASAGGKSAKGTGKSAKGGGGPQAVKTERVQVKPMPVLIEAVGTIEPEKTVQIRAQASGVVEAILFREGDKVQAGQVLFRLDSRGSQASYDQARATLEKDEALLAQARAQQARLGPLLEKDYISKQDYEAAATGTNALEATIKADKALIEQYRVQLEYARIRSPIAGRSGSVAVKLGNLVTASSGAGGTMLVTVNGIQPVLVSFSIPQKDLPEVRRAESSGLRVEIRDDTGEQLGDGKLVFVDNAVNPQTGTVTLKARVANERELLWPGQFVKARLIVRMEPEAVVLSEAALQPGQGGSFVYLVDEGIVRVRSVKVARQLGNEIVIAEGLSGGEQVIAEVPQGLQEGSAVRLAGSGESGKGSGAGKGKGENTSAKRPGGKTE